MGVLHFISVDGRTRVSLDTEDTISVSYPSTVTKTSTSEGVGISHGAIEENITISASGLITYSKSVAQDQAGNLNPIEFQEHLQRCRRAGHKFTVYTFEDGLPLLQDYENCVISDATVTASKYSNSVSVEISFEQVFVSEAAKKTYLKPKPAAAAKPSAGSPDGNGQGTKTKETEKQSESIFFKNTKLFTEDGFSFGGNDGSF